jgi:hypothetical protein
MHIPVLSKTFDFIQRTTAFITPLYQRMLDLPWVRRSRKPRHGYTRTKGVTADRKANINLQPNELYPNVALQTFSDYGSAPVGGVADETSLQAAEMTYPMINSTMLSPLPIKSQSAITAHDFSHVVIPADVTRHTRKIMAQYDKNVQIRPSHLTTKIQPAIIAKEIPIVMKKVLPSPASDIRLSDTGSEASHYFYPASMPPRTEPTTYSLDSESYNGIISPNAGQNETTVPTMYTPYEIREPDHTQAKQFEVKSAEVSRQAHHKYRTQMLPPVLTPITQRINLDRKPTEAGAHIIGESIKETQPYDASHTGTPDDSIGQAIQILHPHALSKQSATMGPIKLLHASPGRTGPTISGDILKRPSLSKPPMIARYPNKMGFNTPVPEVSANREDRERFPCVNTSQSELQIGQVRQYKPLVNSYVELPGEKANATYQTERMIDTNRDKDTVDASVPEHGRTGLGFSRAHVNRPLLFRQPPSIAGSAIQLSSEHDSIHHAMTLATQQFSRSIYHADPSTKTEISSFVPNRESISSYPDKNNIYQKSPELVLASFPQEKAEFNTVHRNEMLTDTSDIFTKPTYSREHNVPDLALAPISRIHEIQTKPAESEPQEAGSSEKVSKDELESITRDVYHILKRRLARERERALGVI